jgi:single-stranded-DNA-specific exonuclease
MHPFESFSNIQKASDIVIDGIKNNKIFCVYFDVDCDGICAGTIMYRYLKHYTSNVKYSINQGKIHGLSHLNIDGIVEKIDILIIVDSLDSQHTVYKQLHHKGIDVIILDHHDFKKYPVDATLVSSAKNYPNPHLSGSGVTWKFCAYLDLQLQNNLADNYLDLCATGIIADVCDVSENSYENRYLCYRGIDNLQNNAIKVLLNSYPLDSQSIIWSIAPLINASQRTNNNLLSLKLFISDDENEIKSLYKSLKEIKIQQDIEVDEIFTGIEDSLCNDYNFLFGFTSKAEYSGLIASKIADKYCKPAIIFYNVCNLANQLRGSIRGGTVDNFKTLINSTNLAKCYGHEVAAGIYLSADNYKSFITTLHNKLKNYKPNSYKTVDLTLKMKDITVELIEELSLVSRVHGKTFDSISVAMFDVEINNPVLLKNKHTKFNYYDLDFIFWNNPKLYALIREQETGYFKQIDVIGELQLNYFAGKQVKQFIIKEYKNLCILPDFLRNENI